VTRPEACADCGTDYWPGRFDVTPPFLCDECFGLRERWAAEQEAAILARRMLKATLPAAGARKDVA
jgi:hypothetical protein